MTNAWVFVIWGLEKYIIGAIAGAQSLRDLGTRHKIVLLYAAMPAKLDYLAGKGVFDEVREVPLLRFQVNTLKTKKQRELYGGYFSETADTKWQALSLVEYDKIIYVDADMIFMRNSDELFDLPAPAATFSNPFSATYSRGGFKDPYTPVKHGDTVAPSKVYAGLHSGFVAAGSLVLLKPDKAVLTDLVALMESRPYGHANCYSAIDEQSLCELYANQGTSWYHIDPIYQVIPWKSNWFPRIPARDLLSLAHGLHFYHDKPWEKGDAQGWEDINVWWRVYRAFEAKHPVLAKKVRRFITAYPKVPRNPPWET